MNSKIPLREGLSYRKLEEGTEFEIDPEDQSSSESDFEDDIGKAFKEEFRKLTLDTNEEIDLSSLTIDELKNHMTPITEDGLVLKLMTVWGSGSTIPDKSLVLMHYNAYIVEDGKIKSTPFDSTYMRQSPCKVLLGSEKIIYGLEKGIATMKKGEHSKFWIDCSYAYGPMGCPPRIPMDANVVYDVEIINFFTCGEALAFENMLPEDQRKAPFSDIYTFCKQEHAMGNDLFKNKKYASAAGRYAKAIKLLESISVTNEEEDNKRDHTLLNLYKNIALCNLNLKKAHRAITYAKKALNLDDKNPKALYCLGQAHSLSGNYEEAKRCLLKVQKLKPYDTDVNNALLNLSKKTEQHLTWEKSFCQKMFPNDKKEDRALPHESEEFVKIISETIDRFQNSSDSEYCFPTTFMPDQIVVIKELALSKNLYFFEKIHDGYKILKIKKYID